LQVFKEIVKPRMLARLGASLTTRSTLAAWLLTTLAACGGAAKPAAAPEGDVWADYKGTFAEPVGARPKAPPAAAKASPPPAPAKENVATASAPLTATTAEPTDAPSSPPPKAKAKRKATGGGKSKAKTKAN
jgi:hypothetical protein